jgi:OFA family oxalate/formate antiporter-like MFS transporter
MRLRWALVGAAILVQLAIGSVYAWSVFNQPLQRQFGWTRAQAVIPFEVAIGCIFIGTLIGGRVQDRRGPRPVALAGGLLFVAGILLSSFVYRADQLWLLILGYGVMGGAGLGAVYITPIAMLTKWFPDRRGLVTGLAVSGFGLGALLTAPVARVLLDSATNKPSAFFPLGLGYFVMILAGAIWVRNPPAPARSAVSAAPDTDQLTLRQALAKPQWYLLTATLFLNITCGIGLISQAADAAREVGRASAITAATMVGTFGLFNGAGRIAYAALSDRIGRMRACVAMLTIQGIVFLLLPYAHSPASFFVLAALIYLSYGGGFGVMPAAAADFFGTRYVGSIYGAMIVAWSLGGVVGPFIAAWIYTRTGGNHSLGFMTLGVIALLAILFPLVTRPPKRA